MLYPTYVLKEEALVYTSMNRFKLTEKYSNNSKAVPKSSVQKENEI